MGSSCFRSPNLHQGRNDLQPFLLELPALYLNQNHHHCVEKTDNCSTALPTTDLCCRNSTGKMAGPQIELKRYPDRYRSALNATIESMPMIHGSPDGSNCARSKGKPVSNTKPKSRAFFGTIRWRNDLIGIFRNSPHIEDVLSESHGFWRPLSEGTDLLRLTAR